MTILTEQEMRSLRKLENGGHAAENAVRKINDCLATITGDIDLNIPAQFISSCDGTAGSGIETQGGGSIDSNFVVSYPTFSSETAFINKCGTPRVGKRFFDSTEDCVKVFTSKGIWVCENSSEICEVVTQAGHGLNILDQVYFDSNTQLWVIGDSSNLLTVPTASVVDVINNNCFKVACFGTYEIPSHGYTECYHFSDPDNPGQVLENPPTEPGELYQPAFCVLGPDKIKLVNYLRPEIIQEPNYNKKRITQAGHGFNSSHLFHGVYNIGGENFALSDASSEATTADAIITEIIDNDTYCIQATGMVKDVNVVGNSIDVGFTYYDDPNVPNEITSNKPSTAGQIIKPLFYALTNECLVVCACAESTVANASSSTDLNFTTGNTPPSGSTEGDIWEDTSNPNVTVTRMFLDGAFREINCSGEDTRAGGLSVGEVVKVNQNNNIDHDFVRGIPHAPNDASFVASSNRTQRGGDRYYDTGTNHLRIYDESTLCDGPTFRSPVIRHNTDLFYYRNTALPAINTGGEIGFTELSGSYGQWTDTGCAQINAAGRLVPLEDGWYNLTFNLRLAYRHNGANINSGWLFYFHPAAAIGTQQFASMIGHHQYPNIAANGIGNSSGGSMQSYSVTRYLTAGTEYTLLTNWGGSYVETYIINGTAHITKVGN